MMQRTLVSSFFLVVLIQYGLCFPNGSPFGRCNDGYPHHNIGTTTTFYKTGEANNAKFEITLDKQAYQSGTEIQVTLTAKAAHAGATFKGFVLRVKQTSGDTDKLLGHWKADSLNASTTKGMYYVLDKKDQFNCLTHRSNDSKASVSAVWVAPGHNAGNLNVVASVVESYAVFNIYQSAALTYSGAASPKLGPSFMPNTTYDSFNFTDYCASSPDMCVKSPSGCGTNCKTYVAWQPDPHHDDHVRFHIASSEPSLNIDTWMAIGWSEDKSMGNDDTVACVMTTDSQANVHYGYNVPVARYTPGYPPYSFNGRHRTVDFKGMQVKKEDGQLQCSFSRPMRISIISMFLPDGSSSRFTSKLNDKSYHLLFAHGYAYSFDSTGKHVGSPWASETLIDFNGVVSGATSSMTLLAAMATVVMLTM